MKKIRKIYYLLLAFVSLSLVQCNPNYLDVSDELAGQLTMKEVFENAEYTRNWHRNIFSGIPNSSGMILDAAALTNPWTGASDELKMAQGTLRTLNANGYNSGNAPFHRWGTLYTLIRQANLFLENAKEIPQTGDTDFISSAELNKMKAQARFLRGYYHYLLFEQYGPIPIIEKSIDPSLSDIDFERNSVQEVVDWIYKELTDVSTELDEIITDQNYLSLPTKGVALAVRAKLMMYAASPLFNGGYTEALALTNPSGKKLFDSADPARWAKAGAAMKEFIDFAESGKYALYKAYTNGTYDPDKSLYELFMSYNTEIIWANPNQSWGAVNGEGVDRRSTPRSENAGFACIAVTQELVDDFFMNDGLPIEESPKYKESGFSIAGDDLTGRTEAGTYNMWVNREPRFYQTVFYHGRKWHLTNRIVKFNRGNGNDNTAADHPWSGYLLYKRISRNVHNQGSFPKSHYRPSIIFRLAEFYLLYAEAMNEIDPSNPLILEYVDRVRERAGIPKLQDIKAQIKGNKDLQRNAIRAEMRIELATEGQRYFDVRRWMIAENEVGKGGQGGLFYGMNMGAATEAEFFKRTSYENRAFEREMYLYPIPLNEIQKSKKLVQNPGW
ncbi:Starch-binding associating with outer membrane [Sphingobacterium nematocida]|uniref:Starch-binding associating with outer membrane n=1 Tax=Sphingobacterium nematocida TaxID=1513896 RepID=A0A1T5DE79_9SPHI|nr:RagB/SusD family nutrient uptake outer membrane protein [Sphingobacterium nematocida]SKB69911.1 Starch-binding associating with outer membrane [Sphingobacterium nematocida]